jgi:hypothetical protein
MLRGKGDCISNPNLTPAIAIAKDSPDLEACHRAIEPSPHLSLVNPPSPLTNGDTREPKESSHRGPSPSRKQSN